MAYRRGSNNLLRAARLALRSSSGSGRPMSRQELADAVNAHTHAHCRSAVDARYIGKPERGEHRWPSEPYRTALREVLGKTTNANLGFFIVKGHAQDPEVSPEEPGPEGSWTSPAPGVGAGLPVSVAATASPVMMARAAAVRVTLSVHAETVTALVRHDDTTGRCRGPRGARRSAHHPVGCLAGPPRGCTRRAIDRGWPSPGVPASRSAGR